MPRIKLAAWCGDQAPGDIVEVDDDTLKAMRRDGLVADVLALEPADALPPAPAEEAAAIGRPEPVVPEPQPGRKRR
ncbi:hypothetical protein [Streptomyces filamentosus]|uniref:hypothetical protein n=1 Tax=Streptomyces filamentosus TaxID=67294 RepID=UPI00123BAB2F|nr:hypothetical protein [Streptomyces filamentosus]KAA6216389.1 hypothetical protein CP979_05100 [Streptomyces filamentosus]